MKKKIIYQFIKRLFDIVFSLLLILITLIPMLIIGLIVKLDSKGPIIFKQKRIGKNKKTFTIYKFRSMDKDVDPNLATHLLTNPKSTKFGYFLRHTSLDELPQLFNILFGQMSFIGPRPALWNQEDLISKRDEYHINDIRPGLTGFAQINGRDEIDIDKKVELDAYYLINRSILLDIKIIFITLIKVIKQSDIEK